MSLLWKDRIIYLTVDEDHCSVLEEKAINDLAMNEISFINLDNHLVHYVDRKLARRKKIDIAIASHLCRILVMPPLKKWIPKEALEYLIQQKFIQKYGDFDPEKFIFLSEKIKMDKPFIVIAYSKEYYQEIIKINKNFRIINLIPAIFIVWNFFEKNLQGNTFLIIEQQSAYLFTHEKNIIKEIDIFPANLAQNLKVDGFFCYEDFILINKNNSRFELPDSIIALLKCSKSQIFNLMRDYG